ncbi:hypothetical protein D3C79_985600 [compost metagenome]
MSCRHAIGSCAMHDTPRTGCIIQRELLPQQTADNARQHIPHTAGGHARIADVRYRHLAPLIGNQRTGTFQHRHATVLRRQLAHCK